MVDSELDDPEVIDPEMVDPEVGDLKVDDSEVDDPEVIDPKSSLIVFFVSAHWIIHPSIHLNDPSKFPNSLHMFNKINKLT